MEQDLKRKRLIWTERLGLFGFLLCMAGLPLSPAMLSIGTVAMIIPAFFSYPLKEQFRRFYQDKEAFLLSLIFIVQLLSFFWTTDTGKFVEHLRIKAPLFFGLFSLAVLGPFDRKWLKIGLMLFVVTVLVTGTFSAVDYLLHREQYDLEIKVSKPLPIFFEINHIYFSLLLAFSIFISFWFYRQKPFLFHKYERYLWLFIAVVNTAYIHIIAARTGLIAFYVALFIMGTFYFFRQKKYLLGVLILVGCVCTPFFGYEYIPSLKQRVENTQMDINSYFSGEDPNHLSLGMRFESWKAAWGLFKTQPVTGVSMADLPQEMAKQYVRDGSLLCENNFLLPHNEFIQIGVGLGLLGLITFSLGWFYPLFGTSREQGWLFWSFWLIVSFGMLGESVVERQIGLMFVVMMWMTTRWLGHNVQELSQSKD